MKLNIRNKEDECYKFRIMEQDVFNVRNSKISLGSIALDLGAHIGLFSLMINNIHKCTVHCYEPEKNNFSCLQQNIIDNFLQNNIIAYNEAIWNNFGTMNLNIDPEAGSYDSHNIFNNKNVEKEKYLVQTIPTKLVFDRIGEQKIGYLKINSEGSEIYILEYILNNNLLPIIENCSLEIHPALIPINQHNDFLKMMKNFVDYFNNNGLYLEVRTAGFQCEGVDIKAFTNFNQNIIG